MFEDATFESAGRIRTRSRRWVIAAFAFYSSILVAMILIPLICPEALPSLACPYLMQALRTPPAPMHPQNLPVQTAQPNSKASFDPFAAPTVIPISILAHNGPEPSFSTTMPALDPGVPGSTSDPILGPSMPRVVHPDVTTPVRIAARIEEGLLIRKTIPTYPPIAKATGVGGRVMLAATISKTGTIENLRVLGGPVILQQAALNAVSTWLYRPYLLDGQPVEVETTVDVIFTLNR
ncbi:MAG: energy transducer TonB [Terracidiphilus sp.]|jgi:protein TonB